MDRSYLTADEVAFIRALALDLVDRGREQSAATAPASLVPARFVTIALASSVTGFTAKAIQKKIEDGVWIEGREYVRRDGRVLIDLRGYERWAETGARGTRPRQRST